MAKGKKKNAEVNVFDNPTSALVPGSAENMAVLEGNEIQGPDELEMKETPEMKARFDRVKELKHFVETAYWELSSLLGTILKEKSFRAKGYTTFESYLTNECGFERRKGYYLVQIHNYFNTELKTILAGKDEDYKYVVDMMQKIGWTKATKIAANKVITPDNAKEVADKAAEKSLRDLEILCKDWFKAIPKDEQDKRNDDNEIKTVRFGCSFTLPQNKDVERALEIARSKATDGSMNKSRALAYICNDFMTTNMAAHGYELSIAETLSKFERLLEITIIAIDERKRKVIYGADKMNQLAQDEEGANVILTTAVDSGTEAAVAH